MLEHVRMFLDQILLNENNRTSFSKAVDEFWKVILNECDQRLRMRPLRNDDYEQKFSDFDKLTDLTLSLLATL